MLTCPWPNVQVFAKVAGEIHPYQAASAHLFRGEETFVPVPNRWPQWEKPSPEPRVDETFRQLLLAAIQREAPQISTLIHNLAAQLQTQLSHPPLLVAILRAGVPVAVLLSRLLSIHFQQPVPVAAFSLFTGVGWDVAALEAILATYPQRPLWFIDGWTSSGVVARSLQKSYQAWLASGRPDFTHGHGIRLAVLSDPGAYADIAATREDRFIPSACFTAPETLGFSRGFTDGSGLFNVYHFPETLLYPAFLHAWLAILETAPLPVNTQEQLPLPREEAIQIGGHWKIHLNEVMRAAINRMPQEIWLAATATTAKTDLAPLLHLCQLRAIPMKFGQTEILAWGTQAAAKMS